MKWISVKKELPKPYVKVVLLFPTDTTRFGELIQGVFVPVTASEKQWTLEPNFWMPLEPPTCKTCGYHHKLTGHCTLKQLSKPVDDDYSCENFRSRD